MKKLLFAGFAALLIGATASAQDIPARPHSGMRQGEPRSNMLPGEPRGMMPQGQHQRGMMKQRHRMEAMKELNITEEQKAKFKAENESFRKSMEDLKKIDNITVKEWKTRQENLRKDHKARMESIFTKEQKDKMAKMKQDRQKLHEDMARVRMDRMKLRLGLSDEQTAKLEKNRQELSGKIKAIRENNNLTEEKKREEIKSLMKQHKESMKSVLTEDQLNKLKQMKEQRGQRGRQGQQPQGPRGPRQPRPAERQTI